MNDTMDRVWKYLIVAIFICFTLVASLFLWALSFIVTEDDGFTDTDYRISIYPEKRIEYILYLPLPRYNDSTSPVLENLGNIFGDAEYEIIDTEKGEALKIVGNGSVTLYFTERLEIERNATGLSLTNSSIITSPSARIENTYWLYFNSTSPVNMSLSANYSEGYASGTYYWTRETWFSFQDMTLVNGWQLVEGYADSPDHLDDAP